MERKKPETSAPIKRAQDPVLPLRTLSHLAFALKSNTRELQTLQTTTAESYKSWQTQKPNGGYRKIDSPFGRTKQLQARLARLLQTLTLPHASHGGRRGRDNLSNARVHVGSDVVLTMDIRSFFPAISHRMVYGCFIELGCTPDVARAITELVTFKGRLPQGAPTSTVVANLVAAPLVNRLQQLAKLHGAKFTQFVDDITLSGPEHVRLLAPLIRKIVSQNRFSIKNGKTKIMVRSTEQEVTGVRVDGGLSVPTRHLTAFSKDLDLFGSAIPGSAEREKLRKRLEGKIGYFRRLSKAVASECEAQVRTAIQRER